MLRWGQWIRSEGCRYHMDRNGYQGQLFSGIFWDAMKLVFTDESDKPGLISQGRVMAEAENILQNRDPIGFTKQDMEKMLYYGDYKFSASYQILITGPSLPEHANSYGAAEINGSHIWFNFYNLIGLANAQFGGGPRGVDRLVYFTGGVMLHEIMHLQGFRHMHREDPNPDHPYNRTLPALAGYSVIACGPSPTDATFLTSDATPNIRCATEGVNFVEEFSDSTGAYTESGMDLLTSQ